MLTIFGAVSDPDKRRAALLSLLFHLILVLLFAWLVVVPQLEDPETFIVIELGTPALFETEIEAATVDAPAPVSQEVQVEDVTVGEPDATQIPVPIPEPSAVIIEAVAPETPDRQLENPEVVVPTPAVEVTQAPSPAVNEAQTATAEVNETLSEAQDLPQTEIPSAALPEIDVPEIALRPEEVAISIPEPSATVELSEARLITTNPSVAVAPAESIPAPQVQVQVAQTTSVPQPDISTAVSPARPVEINPQINVAAPRPVPTPDIAANISTPRAVPQPNVQATLSEARTVPNPRVQANISAAQAIPSPNAQVSVSTAQSIPQPNVEVNVTPPAPANPISSQDPVQAVANPVSDPSNPVTPATTTTETTAGGSDSSPGQPDPLEGADADNLGIAAGPDGSNDPTGANPPLPFQNYSQTRQRPLNVMLDNALGYPQLGLAQASAVYEMPVEGGATRLMTHYDSIDPGKVGPVRSARDYFHTLSENVGGILVHDGGSPSALAAIERSPNPSFNAFSSGNLFARDGSRNAPYNLYSVGGDLRSAMNRLNLNRGSVINGSIYRPDEVSTTASRLDINYSGAYDSGFRYVPEIDRYRWVRQGRDASDGAGQAVLVEAVLIAEINGTSVIPGDSAGRLYVPMTGGNASLFVKGKVIEGSWRLNGGVSFESEGQPIDLRPFKLWVIFLPQWSEVTLQP